MKFQKGQPKPEGSGRTAGTPNKVTSLKGSLEQALLEEGGVKYFRWVARKYPQAFCSLLGKLLPRDLHVEGVPNHTWMNIGESEEKVEAQLAEFRKKYPGALGGVLSVDTGLPDRPPMGGVLNVVTGVLRNDEVNP